MRRLSDALSDGIKALQKAGIASAVGDARVLLSHAASIPKDRLTLHLQDGATPQIEETFSRYLHQRAQHQPVAQIIASRLFWGRSFRVTQDTLDPRPETEILVAEALRLPLSSVLDLGTGTGCILISILADRPLARGLGCDLSPRALDVARHNAQTLGVAARAQFVQSDWFGSIDQHFDLIVANPPYIAQNEMDALSPDVKDWEPHLALTDGADGLNAYRYIAAGAGARLRAGGRILLEIGPSQGAAVSDLLAAQGFAQIAVLPDFDGRARVVCAHKP